MVEETGPPENSDRALLNVLLEADSMVLKTSEFAEADGITIGRRQINDRLNALEEAGSVRSRVISAGGNVKLWWHASLDVRREWPTAEPIDTQPNDGTIGVEVIDDLDLPGRGETLQKRREAVSAVFKYLFDSDGEDGEVARDMRLVGWGADSDTYQSPVSLWNNCLKKGLDQSQLFRLYKTDKRWKRTEFGDLMRRTQDRVLWVDWELYKPGLFELFHTAFWELVLQYTIKSEHIGIGTNGQRSIIEQEQGEHRYVINEIRIQEPIWLGFSGTLSKTILLTGEDSWLQSIRKARGRIESAVESEIDWFDSIETDHELRLTCSKCFDFDPSDVFRSMQMERGPTRSIRNLQAWSGETERQLNTVIANSA